MLFRYLYGLCDLKEESQIGELQGCLLGPVIFVLILLLRLIFRSFGQPAQWKITPSPFHFIKTGKGGVRFLIGTFRESTKSS